MRRWQVAILWSFIALVLAMCLVPPWRSGPCSLGYHPIFWDRPSGYAQRIDFERLGLQCLALATLGAGIILGPRMWPKRQ